MATSFLPISSIINDTIVLFYFLSSNHELCPRSWYIIMHHPRDFIEITVHIQHLHEQLSFLHSTENEECQIFHTHQNGQQKASSPGILHLPVHRSSTSMITSPHLYSELFIRIVLWLGVNPKFRQGKTIWDSCVQRGLHKQLQYRLPDLKIPY